MARVVEDSVDPLQRLDRVRCLSRRSRQPSKTNAQSKRSKGQSNKNNTQDIRSKLQHPINKARLTLVHHGNTAADAEKHYHNQRISEHVEELRHGVEIGLGDQEFLCCFVDEVHICDIENPGVGYSEAVC